MLAGREIMKHNSENNRTVATQFIEAFNTNDWDTVRKVVAPDYVYHHPIGGTVQAGPEGMVAAWSSFKSSLPDSWHPIPVMKEGITQTCKAFSHLP